ncbi:MAG: ATP-binding protein [Treponema sp.]|jgi:hypothetical protein|nr:ATP-binding protein [Treponema sp.]
MNLNDESKHYEFEHGEFITKTDIEEIENEKQNIPLAFLDHIDRILEMHYSIQNNPNDIEKKAEYQETLDKHLTICSDILGITTLQAHIFSFILNNDDLIAIEDLAKFFKITRVQCLKYSDDLDVLVNKHLIKETNGDFNRYWVPPEVIQALREGKNIIPSIPPISYGLSKDEFFERLNHLFSDFIINYYENRKIRRKKESFLTDFFTLLDNNIQLEFVKNIYRLSLTKANMAYLSYLCTLFYTKQENIFSLCRLDVFEYINDYERININKLFELELIEYSDDDFKERNDENWNYKDKDLISLTHKALIGLLGITDTMLKPKKDSELINHENILKKELFYNENDKRQVEQLTGLFLENNFIKVRERLKSNGMRTGFNCLFFGSPGTGKTETAYQIARISGRDIVPIDISMTKSKWFSESEKRIKNIFTKYYDRVKRANDSNLPVPILLLNEADAIINRRKDTSIGNLAQTENAIQNILLEELEKLDGILIATTNLTENIDTAFERRFIYKINFQKPCVKTRQAIWKNFIPELSGEDANKLAEAFDLSGGQIENIARKCTISGILNGNDLEFFDLFKFCGEETMLNNDSKIGFK